MRIFLASHDGVNPVPRTEAIQADSSVVQIVAILPAFEPAKIPGLPVAVVVQPDGAAEGCVADKGRRDEQEAGVKGRCSAGGREVDTAPSAVVRAPVGIVVKATNDCVLDALGVSAADALEGCGARARRITAGPNSVFDCLNTILGLAGSRIDIAEPGGMPVTA